MDSKVDWLPEETIIPNLPNDIALHCLARVPRQYHPILAAVSKPIRFIVSSPEFFAARSRLNHSEEILYLRPRSDFDPAAEMFAVYPNPSGDTPTRVARIPPLPVHRLNDSASVVLGHNIYIIGGWFEGDPLTRCLSSRRVWVLDCRTTTWSPGPNMLAARSRCAFATVVGGKIYVVGGTSWTADPFAEVLDPSSGIWEAVPEPPRKGVGNRMVCHSVAMGDKIHVWVSDSELRFDTVVGTWETRKIPEEEMRFLVHKCVVEEQLYSYHRKAGRIVRLDETGNQEWVEVAGPTKWLQEKDLVDSKMVAAGQSLVFVAAKREAVLFFSGDLRIEVSKKKRSDRWFTSIKVDDFDQLFFPLDKTDAPLGSPRYDLGYTYPDCECFSVSL